MTRLLPLLCPTAAACLLAAGHASFAAASSLTEELLTPLTSAYMRAVKPGEEAEVHQALFEEVLQRVERTYAREVDVPALVAAALKTVEPLAPQSGEPADVFKKTINAALATLDPHSRYLDPRSQTFQRSVLTGSFGGVGLQVEMVEGLVRVLAPIPGTPAARAGLQRGDLILGFDDQPVQGMTLAVAISRMRGEPGSPITLKIRREGQVAEFSVSLVREIIRTQVLAWSMEEDVLLLRLSRFTGSAPAALDQAIAEASALRQPRGIVLDMRGNGGGLFRPAVTMADAFLSEGEIVSLRGRTASNQRRWHADAAEYLAGVPMVVLIDGRSASAAELVAAALQENGRAIVMGERSYGKGSLQSIVPLGGDKGALRLTTALYHGPSGRTVQRTGVGPDIELAAAAENTAAARRREADRAEALPGADEPLPPKARVEPSRCPPAQANADPALACALAFLAAGKVETFLAALQPAESASAPPQERDE